MYMLLDKYFQERFKYEWNPRYFNRERFGRVVEPSENDTTSYKSSDWQDVSVWNSSLFKTIRPLNKTQGDDQNIERKLPLVSFLVMMKNPRLFFSVL